MTTMTQTFARKFGKVQDRNTKIEGSVFNLPTWACITGSKLREVEGTPCENCYAVRIEKGVHGKTVLQSEEYNLQGWLGATDEEWVQSMVVQIGAARARKLRKGITVGADYHRWFASGDCQSFEMLLCIVEVAKRMPVMHFWLPTQEKGMVARYIAEFGAFPDNLTVRVSAAKVNSNIIATDSKGWLHSVVQRGDADVVGHKCEATFNAKQKSCNGCTACWDKSVPVIVYKDH